MVVLVLCLIFVSSGFAQQSADSSADPCKNPRLLELQQMTKFLLSPESRTELYQLTKACEKKNNSDFAAKKALSVDVDAYSSKELFHQLGNWHMTFGVLGLIGSTAGIITTASLHAKGTGWIYLPAGFWFVTSIWEINLGSHLKTFKEK